MLPGAKQFAQLYQSHAKGAKGTDRIMAGQNHGDFTGANRDNRDIKDGPEEGVRFSKMNSELRSYFAFAQEILLKIQDSSR